MNFSPSVRTEAYLCEDDDEDVDAATAPHYGPYAPPGPAPHYGAPPQMHQTVPRQPASEPATRLVSNRELLSGPWNYAQRLVPLFSRIGSLGACVIVYMRVDPATRRRFSAVRRVDPTRPFAYEDIFARSSDDDDAVFYEVPDVDPQGRIEYPELMVLSVPQGSERLGARGSQAAARALAAMEDPVRAGARLADSDGTLAELLQIEEEAERARMQDASGDDGAHIGALLREVGAPAAARSLIGHRAAGPPSMAPSRPSSGVALAALDFSDKRFRTPDRDKVMLLTRDGEEVFMSWYELRSSQDPRVKSAANYLLKQFPGLVRHFLGTGRPSRTQSHRHGRS